MQSVFLLVLVSLSMCHYTESIQITTSDAATVKYLTKELKGWGGKLRSDVKEILKSNGGKLNVGAAYLKNNRVAPEGIDHPPAAHEWMHWYRIVVVASVAPPAYGN